MEDAKNGNLIKLCYMFKLNAYRLYSAVRIYSVAGQLYILIKKVVNS